MDLITFIVVALIISATATILSELLRPKPKFEQARPSSLGDFQFPTATEGRVVPVIWGTVKVAGPNVIWYGDLKNKPIKKTVKTGLWSSKSITQGFKYYIGIQFGLCRGPESQCLRVWVGNKFLTSVATDTTPVSAPKFFGGNDLGGNGGIVGTINFYRGAEDQVQNTYLSSRMNPLPAYRGTAYAVFEQGYIGNSTQIKPWAFEMRRLPNPLELDEPAVNAGNDLNVANAVYELLTNDEWGFGHAASDIDITSFLDAAEVLDEEQNGVSMIIDTARDSDDILKEFERQMDGVVRQNRQTGKWEIKLARGGYDVDDIPQIDSTNLIAVREFTRGSWEETSNQVRIAFSDRARDYFNTSAQATDLANQRIQGGKIFPSQSSYPGVKDKTLANQIASRNLRRLSAPLAKATLEVDRSLWELNIGDVVAWTDDIQGFEQLTMRVLRVDWGTHTDNKITLTLVQDVFEFAEAFSGEPPDPLWEPPTLEVEPIPEDESLVMEAPKAIVDRDPDGNTEPDRIWAGGRIPSGSEVSFNIYTRNDPVTPTGDFKSSGTVYDFLFIGTLRSDILGPDDEIEIDPDPDAVSDLFAAFTQGATEIDLGVNLTNLMYINGEFFDATDASDEGDHVALTGCFRGLLDSAPATHLTGEPIFLMFVAGGLTDDAFERNFVVDVKLVTESTTDILDPDDAPTIQVELQDRYRSPYPPTVPNLNGVDWEDDVNFDESLT